MDTYVPHFLRDTPFRRRVWTASSIGRICKGSSGWVSLPLYHRRPHVPFKPRQTLQDRAYIDRWMSEELGIGSRTPARHLSPAARARRHPQPDWWSSVTEARRRRQD